MLRQWSLGLQFVAFLVLFSASIGLWLSRDIVGEAFASLSKSAGSEGGRGARADRGSRPLPVIVARVAQGTDRQTIAAVGTARAKRAVMLNAKADGIIVTRNVTAGDRVKQGDTLFLIDASKAELLLKLAEKRLADTKRLLDRSSYLKRQRVNSGATVEDAESAFRKSELEVAQFKELLRDLNVTAPFSGVVGISKFEVGDRVTAGMAVMSLDDRRELVVEFDVPEQYLPRMKVGGPVKGTTPSYPTRTFSGMIAAIDSRVDPLSRSVKVRAEIDNRADDLRPGMSFAVSIDMAGDAFPSVPQLALQWRGRESYVWIAEDGKVRRQPVTAVRRLTENVLLSGDVKVGDLVVVEGVQRLRPGRAVSFEVPPPVDAVVTSLPDARASAKD